MGINKIRFGNTTLIDLTSDTVSADKLMQGYTAHDNTGTLITGTASGGSPMNCQVAQSTRRSTSSSYTEVIALTCTTTGTYDVYWTTFRSSTSGTWGSRLYLDNTAYDSAHTDNWSNHVQNIHLTGVQIDANQEVAVRVRSRGNSYYGYVGTLTIKQTA